MSPARRRAGGRFPPASTGVSTVPEATIVCTGRADGADGANGTAAGVSEADRGGPPALGPAAGRRRLNVLVVEDHDDSRRLMAMLLRSFGYTVHAAGTVGAAKAAAAGERFDVLVSDVGLPDGTGTELMRDLRRLYDLPGVALTGHGLAEDVRRCQEAGFAEHLTKPVDPQQLRAAIDRTA